MRWIGRIALLGALLLISEPAVTSVSADEPAVRAGTRPERTPLEVVADRRLLLEELAAPLQKGDLAPVVARFTPKLLEELPESRLKSVWAEIAGKHGPFRHAQPDSWQSVAGYELWRMRLKGEGDRIELRFELDGQDRICGLWFVEPENVSDQVAGAYAFGDKVRQIATAKATVDVKVLDAVGQPAQEVRVSLYREVVPGEATQQRDWVEAAHDKRWRYIAGSSGTGTVTVTQLLPGRYRALAEVTGKPAGPFGLSDPIEVAESQPTPVSTVRLQVGGTMRISAIASDSGQPLTKAGVYLKRQDGSWPALSLKPRKEGETFVFEHVPPAKYAVSAVQSADVYDQPQYETTEARELSVEAGTTLDVTLSLQGRPLTKEEQDQRAPWIATGRVTDKEGKPIEGVEIWGSAGWGSLFSGKFATTDKDGRYYGRFSSSGVRYEQWEADPLELVSAQVGARKAGMTEANINRHGGSYAANRLPKPDEKMTIKDIDPSKLFLRGQPREINFVLVPAVQATVQLLDAQGNPLTTGVTLSGHELPPASSAYSSAKADANQRFTFEEIPPTYTWWLEARIEPRRWSRSVAFKFPAEANKYHLVVQHQVEELTGIDQLTVVSATDAAGKDVKAQILVDDKSQRPPVAAALQEQGREILRKVREVNRYWLIGPPPEVKEYSYQFTLLDREVHQVKVPKPMYGRIYERRGISYFSAIDYITARPDQVIFRAVDIGESQIELVYALKEAVKVSAGNGVAGSWAGYFSKGVWEGTVIIDRKTHTVIEHRTDELTEKLSNYTEIRPGHYVPLRIQVSKMEFDWTFKVHQPGLWLFDKANLKEPRKPGTIEVTNVVVQTDTLTK